VLLDGIKKRQALGQQSILFLNRRGYHTTLLCQDCGKGVKCTHCEAVMTFHKGQNQLACHLCGFTHSPPPQSCPSCRSTQTLKYRGIGTEQVEKALHAIFPDIRTMRMDADTTRHKGSHQKLVRDFGTGKADVLIGTQMIAKGLHFPEVTLVGVLNSDGSLNMPDFRASEMVFQLITQVAGRAGRGRSAGEVIIQTTLPDNNTINLAARQDYQAFYAEEIGVRNLFSYPPFSNLAKLTFSGVNEHGVRDAANRLRGAIIAGLPSDCEAMPVVASGHAKIKDRFRFQLLLRGPSVYAMNRAIRSALESHPLPRDVQLLIDINPTSTFF
jgi:primosomal protein N' (replication factor Y)